MDAPAVLTGRGAGIGFVDMQTEDSDLIENVGAIPFLDYKHFAAKIFFPEVRLETHLFRVHLDTS